MKETKTNAMRILDRAGISYRIHTYPLIRWALVLR